ncbi:unnamed protein product, partial [Phaeothamnion confervicola]
VDQARRTLGAANKQDSPAPIAPVAIEEPKDGGTRLRAYARTIAGTAADLSDVLAAAREMLDGAAGAEKHPIVPAEIVAYAQRISGTTAAPPDWEPGMPMVNFRPPAPTEETMRSGALSLASNAAGRAELEARVTAAAAAAAAAAADAAAAEAA